MKPDLIIGFHLLPCLAVLASKLDLPFVSVSPVGPQDPMFTSPYSNSNRRLFMPAPLSYLPQMGMRATTQDMVRIGAAACTRTFPAAYYPCWCMRHRPQGCISCCCADVPTAAGKHGSVLHVPCCRLLRPPPEAAGHLVSSPLRQPVALPVVCMCMMTSSPPCLRASAAWMV